MNATIVAVDLAKSVSQLAAADGSWKASKSTDSPAPSSNAGSRIVMFVWSSWKSAVLPTAGALAQGLGIEIKLLPAAYIRAYVKRNKTYAADVCALLEAACASDIMPVRVKSVEQQALQGLHRTRMGLCALAASIPCAVSAANSA